VDESGSSSGTIKDEPESTGTALTMLPEYRGTSKSHLTTSGRTGSGTAVHTGVRKVWPTYGNAGTNTSKPVQSKGTLSWAEIANGCKSE
jgi:hypothetical protein